MKVHQVTWNQVAKNQLHFYKLSCKECDGNCVHQEGQILQYEDDDESDSSTSETAAASKSFMSQCVPIPCVMKCYIEKPFLVENNNANNTSANSENEDNNSVSTPGNGDCTDKDVSSSCNEEQPQSFADRVIENDTYWVVKYEDEYDSKNFLGKIVAVNSEIKTVEMTFVAPQRTIQHQGFGYTWPTLPKNDDAVQLKIKFARGQHYRR